MELSTVDFIKTLGVSFAALFGSEILAFFGISLFVVQIAGGLVVAATGWNLLNQPDDDSSSEQVPGTLEDALQHASFR